MVRGAYAHEVLETTYRRLREETGSRRVTPANLPDAERLMLKALEEHRAEFRISPDQTRARAAVRRLEFDLLRYLAHEAASDSEFEPAELELGFGFDAEQEVALNGVKVRGRVDRVDVWDRFALVRDYKTGSNVSSYKLSDWEKENRLQVALYMLAVQRVLGLEPAGGVYVPLGGVERRPRGMVAEEVAARLGADFFDNDVVPQADFERHLERAREAACDVVERLRAGRISPCPDSCAWRGRGCSYPAICREES
jgi:RecB family exonuclease